MTRRKTGPMCQPDTFGSFLRLLNQQQRPNSPLHNYDMPPEMTALHGRSIVLQGRHCTSCWSLRLVVRSMYQAYKAHKLLRNLHLLHCSTYQAST